MPNGAESPNSRKSFRNLNVHDSPSQNYSTDVLMIEPSDDMANAIKHFHGIDGLRAWLAWTVVLSHVFLLTAADLRVPVLQKLDNAADQAVSVFIIISGFVITHLILEKKEAYLPYITRRVLRIYPVYIICLAFGIASTWLYIQTFSGHPWGEWLPQPGFFRAQTAVYGGSGFVTHLLAHLVLLHGAIPNNILDRSEFMFLGPAWSLSLEWQFYLLAPLILFLLRYPWGKIFVALAAVIGYYAFISGRFGDFDSLCILPAAGLLFAVGIGTRLIIRKMPRPAVYPLAGVIVAGFIKMSYLLEPFVIWAAFVTWMVMDRPVDKPSIFIKQLLGYAFDSRPARYLGERSYSTYLVHYPIAQVASFVGVKVLALGMWQTVFLVFIFTPLLTLVASIALYNWIEVPAIAFGKRLFNENR
jgi:peptidoglycan/LPS O-acetylase OafA/YrhL